MSYSAMIFLMLAILSALLGFGPIADGLAAVARVLAVAFGVLCLAAQLLPYLRREVGKTAPSCPPPTRTIVRTESVSSASKQN